jgi:hypothetical protein
MRSILKNDVFPADASSPLFEPEWKATMMAFLLAATAGIFMRIGLITGEWAGLYFGNVRHAHSHLMLFSWATSAWMILLARSFAANGQNITGMRSYIRLSILLGFLSFMPFLLWGYTPAAIGNFRIPFSIILSTLIIFVWYRFAYLYFRNRQVSGESFQLLNVSVIAMVVCTAGAWLRAVFVALKLDNPVFAEGAVHAFLTILTDGWLLAGLLGLAALRSRVTLPRGAVTGVMAGLALSFLVHHEQAPDALRWTGAVFMTVFAVSLLLILHRLSKHISRFVYVSLGIALLLRLLYAVPQLMHIIDGLQLRITYLHLLYLSCISTMLLELSGLTDRELQWFFASTVLLVSGTLPMSGLWPSFDSGILRTAGLWFMAISSLGPPLMMLMLLLREVRRQL